MKPNSETQERGRMDAVVHGDWIEVKFVIRNKAEADKSIRLINGLKESLDD